MVRFQCEDCGENLKKPKLPNHFRICSAYKLSCIDCGEIFTQQTVQSHMQCITEAEKYGPKNQAKPAQNAQIKEAKPKPNLDVDINVGLSTRPPWFCSLCNTTTTSKQTLLLHADGKKHRNKAKAFHASKNQIAGPTNKEELNGISEIDSSEKKIADDLEDVKVASSPNGEKKRKIDALNQVESNDSVNGEVIQSNKSDAKSSKKSKNGPQSGQIDHINVATNGREDDSSDGKIKWKKMIVSILKSNPEGVLKVKKLQKLVTKSLLESGVAEPKDQLQIKLIEKITSSSRFIIDGNYVHLTKKTKSS